MMYLYSVLSQSLLSSTLPLARLVRSTQQHILRVLWAIWTILMQRQIVAIVSTVLVTTTSPQSTYPTDSDGNPLASCWAL